MQLTCTGIKLINFVKKLIIKIKVVGETFAIFLYKKIKSTYFGNFDRHENTKIPDMKNNI